MMNANKYSIGYYPAPGEYYDWVRKDHIEKPPHWCSVDMRDGNQSLVIPMSFEEKLKFYQLTAGGFVALGRLLALINRLGEWNARRHGAPAPLPVNLDCRHCTMCGKGK